MGRAAADDGHYGSWAPSPSVMIANLVATLSTTTVASSFRISTTTGGVSVADKAALRRHAPVEAQLKQSLGLAAISVPRGWPTDISAT